MTQNSDPLRRSLRRWLAPLKSTPLHPQWLVARMGRERDQWVAARAVGRVLDIGCADSAIRAMLAQAATYTGLDYPTTATGLYDTRPDVFGNASQLPFAESAFDCVMLLDVLEHVAEPDTALGEALRVLRPGGHLLLTIPFAYPLHDRPHDYQRFTEYGLVHRLKQIGYSRIAIREAGDAIESAAISMVLALAQGSIEAISARNWRIIAAPLALLLIPFVNITGWLFAHLLPAPRLLPSAYYVQAYRT